MRPALLALALAAACAATGPARAAGEAVHPIEREWSTDGPFGTFGVQGSPARPPYGDGSLGIEVADRSTSLSPPSEKAAFGNEVDFYGDPVLGLNRVGLHVFQTGENVSYGGRENLPNITFEINPNLNDAPAAAVSCTRASMHDCRARSGSSRGYRRQPLPCSGRSLHRPRRQSGTSALWSRSAL